MLSVLNLVSLEFRLFPVPVLDQSLEFFLGHLHHSTMLLFGEIGADERGFAVVEVAQWCEVLEVCSLDKVEVVWVD